MNDFSDILGQDVAKSQLSGALLAKRHVIIVGPPGVGKTTIAKNVAKTLADLELMDCQYHCSPRMALCPACLSGKSKKKVVKGIERFVRIQGSPDLSAEDLLGSIDPVKALSFGPTSLEAFTPGKIFQANQGVLFFDELNRCPEKLQNALLQVLEEGIANLGAYKVPLPASFIFIGTMNPEETGATEKLSDVFLDRFDLISLSWPESIDTESDIVMKNASFFAEFPSSLLRNSLLFIRLLRENKDLSKHPGVRASIGVCERASAHAHLEGRKKVCAKDVEAVLVSVLAHRIELKPSAKHSSSVSEFIMKQFQDFISHNPDFVGECL
ncbi:AAA family ATPase [Candidatus Woesearchaeota archaeon]|nr:AAA family ATPase [Candidatus Woesearchaeota archaeon]